MDDILIAGAGIGGLTLALELHAAGVPCRLVEAAPRLEPLGVGINILPHASRRLHRLGLAAALDGVAVRTREAVYYNRFGQLIYTEPVGQAAGNPWPQYSLHRGDLQMVLLDAVQSRLGVDAVAVGHRLVNFAQDEHGVTATIESDGRPQHIRAGVLVGCDGVHSAVRRQLHPGEEGLTYSGYTMWRGTTRWPPFLTGASMVRAGWLATGKMVIYPIRHDVDGSGLQLINWVAELETPQRGQRDWTQEGSIEDVVGPFADWHFDWLDVPELLRAADRVLEYPMVDQEPLERWSFGRVTLLGDAAHPMLPRGSNGAGQAILDAGALAARLAKCDDPVVALTAYEGRRREATSEVVRLNRADPPDAILREVYERTGDKPFGRIEDVMDVTECEALLDHYRSVTSDSVRPTATEERRGSSGPGTTRTPRPGGSRPASGCS
jgi:2-polyprenyl-6-methoxyphenol hydroxylase-like FAD-dependent oxidoreductase